MTTLIDTIEAAFDAACDDSGELRQPVGTERVVEAIEVYCGVTDDRLGSLETIVINAYRDMQHKWGYRWADARGDVAEAICDGLRGFVVAA